MRKWSTQSSPADEYSEARSTESKIHTTTGGTGAIWGSRRCFAFSTLVEAVWGLFHVPITLRPAEFEVPTNFEHGCNTVAYLGQGHAWARFCYIPKKVPLTYAIAESSQTIEKNNK
ncbi:hypothetical protein BDV24DRAFT_158440 [Aspergillus arachidicola]|uniref:Uncharacterized protein n=1 Tax=Aspergillus arachidicola TaxID=656916 RepID=A0A2G7FUX1_9EURO|nr:hypothetical protein BDV24DRAFT_158440 [Aspergillus arachidicola]PIG84376.1 hypothetical protein AARAC_003936 [Aspergillus arachidicola]